MIFNGIREAYRLTRKNSDDAKFKDSSNRLMVSVFRKQFQI
jgi:hypothetical protein